jgi:hypothetical protein
MRKALAWILAAAALAGCESNAVPNASPLLRIVLDPSREQSYGMTREGVLIQARGVHTVVALPGWLWVGAPHCTPDLALGPKGEVIITSNVVPTLWKIDPQTFRVTVHPLRLDTDDGKDVGFAAIAYSAEQAAFVAYSEVQRSVWKIDPLMTGAVKVADLDLNRSRKGQRCRDLDKRLADFIGG